MRLQPLICVRDVEASSRWYQRLLGCQSAHGGPEYERLAWQDGVILKFDQRDVGNHQGRIGDPNITAYGNGVLLWFVLDDFDAAVARAKEIKAEVIKPRHRSENAHWECWLRDPEGYTIVLASPLGSAA